MNQTTVSTGSVHHGTKERILDAAERMFAEHGFQAASLRQITAEAGVNLAAVNYHFQSKEALLTAVIHRCIEPVNLERLRLLDALEKAAGDGPLDLEAVVHALLAPMFTLDEAMGSLRRLLGRLYSDPETSALQMMFPAVLEVVERFRPAFLRAMPRARFPEAMTGMYFAIGAAAHFLATGHMLKLLGAGQVPYEDRAWVLDKLVRYTAAGLRALTVEEARP